MSGRWRSHYWTPNDGEAQQQQQPNPVHHGRMRKDDVDGGDRYHEHNGDGRNGWGYSEYDFDGYKQGNSREERYRNHGHEFRQFGSHQNQQQRQHQQPHHPHREWSIDRQREWQRGQSLPQYPRGRESMESVSSNQGRQFIKRDNPPSRSIDRQANNTSKAHANSITNKIAIPDSTSSNAQVTAKKPFAWNKPESSLQEAAAKSSSAADPAFSDAKAVAKKPFAWGKPDPSPLPASASASASAKVTTTITTSTTSSATSAEVKGSTKKAFAWGTEATNTSYPTGTLQSKEHTEPFIFKQPHAASSSTMFPPLNEQSKEPPASAKVVLPSSASLPPTSSWGKRHSESDSAKTPNVNKEKPEVKVEDFPSLSMASTLSRSQPGYQNPPPPPLPMTKAMDFTTDKQQSKSKSSSKNGAPHASLASFISNQAVVARGMVSKDANSSALATKKNCNTSSTSMVGTKRSAPSSSTRGAMADGRGCMNFAAGDTKKGRQRLIATNSTPRKKKLTTLKKKVLKERLRVWKEKNGIVDCDEEPCTKRPKTDGSPSIQAAAMEVAKEAMSTTLLIENFIRPEDNLVDEDEYDEILSDLIQLAGRVGEVLSVFIPRPQDIVGDMTTDDNDAIVSNDHIGLAFVRFVSKDGACAANEILEGMVVGGYKIRTSILNSMELADFSDCTAGIPPSADTERLWRLAALRVVNERRSSMNVSDDKPSNDIHTANTEASAIATIVFHKILCEDDYEDEEALHESIEDLKGLAAEYGQVVGAKWETNGDNRGNVYITYDNQNSADIALKKLNGLVVGGTKIFISLDDYLSQKNQQSTAGEVMLSKVLNDDDLEDEDCLSESIKDIRNLAEQYGIIGNVHAEINGEQKGDVLVSYSEGHQVAQQAAQQLDGMVFGGRQLSASVREIRGTDSSSSKEQTKSDPLPVMLSGGKRISEQFAACKRVPKVPNAGTPRSYASKIADERAVPLLIDMLGELMRLQERSKDDKNARARRRLVMGLREVARGIRAHKVKMVVMANNLDEYGAIDSKLQEILDMASADELPVLYELNKRKLGKALGKSIKVSVVGIQNADGAHDQFKKLKKMLGMA
ncbi:hypothetical protein ACHAWU_001969 [Discostella pseudostelligera]|uniref:RRM domain-containing protein n=1 Tax=Discostella pseudostelligera TaxID=259834 RepID=A0ABD3MH14_9STRA